MFLLASPLLVADEMSNAETVKKPEHIVPSKSGDNVRVVDKDAYVPGKKPGRVKPLDTHEKEFINLDLNRDGMISRKEANSEYALRDSFDFVDDNSDNMISLKEYKPYYRLRYRSMANTRPLKNLETYSSSKDAFEAYDKNDDGVLSISEFSNATGKGSDGIPDPNQKKPSGPALEDNAYDPDPS